MQAIPNRRTIATLVHSGKLILTFMEEQPSGSIQFHNATFLVNIWLDLKKEPFRFGITREGLKELLIKTGWKLETIIDHKDLRAKYLCKSKLAKRPLAIGECLAIAQRNASN